MGPVAWWRARVVGRPRPDVRILELEPTGGGTFVDFAASIQNRGTRECRCGIAATVADREVECTPAIVDLVVNAPPTRIAISVPRPELGELVDGTGGMPTLYGAELVLRVNDGKRMTSRTWVEREAGSGPPHGRPGPERTP